MPKVSVIVPVYNPGANISDCISSLLEQTIGDYEVIYVDDGSTDETPARLDAQAAEHEHVRVEHIPNSGWPGKPRNVGLDMARGEFVYFVDNDDWLGPEALERMVAMAEADAADVVIGKVVGHNGRYVPPGLFRRNLHAVSMRDAPLVSLLSPHKLFRRSFVDEHGLRFPEGRRRLEDHVFVLRAYFLTQRVSVLADYPCYHWVVRGDANASAGLWDPVMYYAAVREVLDIVDEFTEPGEERDELYMRWYRAKTLGRIGGSRSVITARPPEWQRQAFDEIRALVLERFPETLDARLPLNERRRAALVRAGDFDGVLELARFERGLKAQATLTEAREEGDGLVLAMTLRLRADGAPLRLGPEEAAVAMEHPWARVLVRSTAKGTQDMLPVTTRPRLENGELVMDIEATVDPREAAGGAALAGGDYDHPVVLHVAGYVGDGVLSRRGGLPVVTHVGEDGRARPRAASGRALRWAVARRMPRLARAVKRLVAR